MNDCVCECECRFDISKKERNLFENQRHYDCNSKKNVINSINHFAHHRIIGTMKIKLWHILRNVYVSVCEFLFLFIPFRPQ